MKIFFNSLLRKGLWLLLGLTFFSMLLVASLKFFNPPTWMWKLQRQISPPYSYLATRHQWADWPNISTHMKLAVIAAEDQLYPQHPGFDFDSIAKALESNSKGKQIRGASTISQQTAKNLFLWPGKNFLRKGIEAWFTILMEWFLTKQRILELYLNIVELGPGIFGVEAASQYYYSKSARFLTRREAARLAAVLPNPYRFHVNRPSSYINKRTEWIEKQMHQLGTNTLKKIN